MSILTNILNYITFYAFTALCVGAVICCKMKKRKLFPLRLISVPIAGILLNRRFYSQVFDIDLSYVLNTYVFPHIIIFVVTVLILWFCYDINIIFAFFFQSLASVCEHILYNIKNIISTLMFESFTFEKYITYQFICIALAIAICVLAYFIVAKRLKKNTRLDEYKKIMIAFSVVNITYTIILSQWAHSSGLLSLAVFAFRIIICICFVALPFMVFHFSESRVERQMYEQMYIQSEKQRQLSKENVKAINLKCHDLKYQISALKEVSDENERKEIIANLEKDIMINDAVSKTGNKTVDVIMTEKCLLCDNYGINFTYIVDGAQLDFMKKADVYSLLGNALDNAIEAVRTLDESKRIISLQVIRRENLININLENYCEREVKFADGIPQTTKKDKTHHGFGIRSMIAIAEKYDGQVFIDRLENSFRLNILFLVKRQDTKG